MNQIAAVGTDFFHAGALHHPVAYYSLESLKGAAISIAIGVGLYLLVVRRFLMKDGSYVNRWPKWLDLEELVYRPLLLRFLPWLFGGICSLFGENRLTKRLWQLVVFIGGCIGALFGENRITLPVCRSFLRVVGIVSRALCDLLDAVVLLLRKTVYRESPPQSEDKFTATISYRFGSAADRIAVHRGKERPEEHRYAHLSYRLRKTFVDTTHRLTGNLSFALLMLCAAACLVFLYILLLHQ